MIPEYRIKFNEEFRPEIHQQLIKDIEDEAGSKILFRVAETPVFVPAYLRQRLKDAGEDILSTLLRPDFKEITEKAIPDNLRVPNEDNHPNFLCIDFAICLDDAGLLTPQLIEFQGFPSLYGWQADVAAKFQKHYNIPKNFDFYIDCDGHEEYLSLLKKSILGQYQPDEVILLEIKPEEQKTNIDFYIIEKWLGVKPICLSKLKADGNKLYYLEDGNKKFIKRIYNRVIFDDLHHQEEFTPGVDLTKPYDIEWAGHPNWFFRISKYTMPFLESPFVPKTRFLSDFDQMPTDLSKYVLKPLFSFSGQGVIFDVKQDDIDQIPLEKRGEFILQEKVEYAPVLQAPNGLVKVEIRLLYLWPEGQIKPTLAANLTRLSKGTMIGVRYNENQDWVGGTVSFMEK